MLSWIIIIFLISNTESNFWLYPGQSAYTVISDNDTYTEVVVNEPSRSMALVATDDYFIYYNEFGSFHCVGYICGADRTNYRSMQDCGLSEICENNRCTSGTTTIMYNQKGYPVTGVRKHSRSSGQEILKNFKVLNFTTDEAYNRIIYLINYLSTVT